MNYEYPKFLGNIQLAINSNERYNTLYIAPTTNQPHPPFKQIKLGLYDHQVRHKMLPPIFLKFLYFKTKALLKILDWTKAPN